MRVRWCVAFLDVDTRGSWLRRLLGLLRPGFRHCFAFREVPGGVLVVQMTVARLQVDYLPGDSEAAQCAEVEAAGGRVVVVERDVDDAAWTPRPMSCVDVVQALAASKYRIQTPFMLWRALSRGWESSRGR